MKVSAKGDEWGGVCRMREVGGLVGRRAVGRSFPKKTWGQWWGKKKVIKILCPKKKKKN
jgi:hypothetical protein